LKEHPFFASIDWKALALKQVTPPFKPVVESDESVDNFDAEFTTADVRDVGPADLFDDEDPSEDWVALSQSQTAPHTPNGPLGSDRLPMTHLNGHSTATNGSSAKGIDIVAKKKKKRDVAGTPLTNSMQENFIGFTFHGESVLPAGAAGILKADGERALADEEFVPDFDVDDEEGLVGRYANRRRGDNDDGLDGDMNF
jgi:serine/threonine protein kinase SCH9